MSRFPMFVPSLLAIHAIAFGEDPPAPATTPSSLAEKPITDADRRHWAFVPPVTPGVPMPADRSSIRNPIDAFILAPLDELGLTPSTDADRATWIRRLSFDLRGVPPTVEELDRFLTDDKAGAIERLVDQFLADPRYGERQAQHWLDLARYADTDGFEFDQTRADAWRYRDWVVDAMNADMPYDEFVRLQIAGDELAPESASAFVATGFNRCYPDMVDLNDQNLRRQNALNDITETTGLVFLGLTLGCARCHDHKFDPIRQSDFYRLQAFFTPARFRDDYPLATPAERKAFESKLLAWRIEQARIQSLILEIEEPSRSKLAAGPPPGSNDDTTAAFQVPPRDRDPRLVEIVFEATRRDRRIKPEDLARHLGAETSRKRDELLAKLKRHKTLLPAQIPSARGLDEVTDRAPATHLLRRGDFQAKGPEVRPGFPVVLSRPDESVPIRPRPSSTGRRSALAAWLTAPSNPLTARVIVNRVWKQHFGRGLAANSSDFGFQGAEPTHPELLDWLTLEFVRTGWSLKNLRRLITTSSAYLRSSRTSREAFRTDPENSLLWRMNRRRLDGEAIRDALLAVSGTLNAQMQGPCVFPDLPAELTRLSAKGAIWPVSPRPEDRNRRSLYVFTRRNLRFPFFEAFDRPDTNASCPERPTSTSAPQALTLLNGKISRDASSRLALRIRRTAGDAPLERVRLAYRLALSRSPDSDEVLLALEFIKDDPARFDDFCLALLNLNEFVYID